MVRVLSLLSALTLLLAVQHSSATKTSAPPPARPTSGLQLYGVNYNIRAGADWEPEVTKCKSADVIAQELTKLKSITDTIRLYSLTDCNQAAKVLPAAAAVGLKVTLGLWVGPDPATFEAEKSKLLELLSQPGLVTAKSTPAIYVGSEAVYRGDVNASTAIANAKTIKSLCTATALNVPITIADTTEVYLKHPSMLDAVDFASPNVFPFWDKIPAAKGPAQLWEKLQRLAKIAKGKDIVIGETGWPTDGVEPKGSKASMANAATYFSGFYALAQQHQLKYYYFAGFDESWKVTNASATSTIEAYFGLYDKNGALKDAYAALQPTATVVPTVTPTAMPSATPTAAPTASPSSTPSAASSTGSATHDVDAGEATTSTKAPVVTSAPSVDAGEQDSSESVVTNAPAATTNGDATNSVATTAPATPPAATAGETSGVTNGKVVIPSIGDNYVPGGVTSAKDDANASDDTSIDTNASAASPSAAPSTTATKSPKPKRKDCDM